VQAEFLKNLFGIVDEGFQFFITLVRPCEFKHFHFLKLVLAFQAARASTGELLDRLTETQWSKVGTHPEHDRYSVERWLEVYAAHAHKHAEQISRARASVRK
jgi:hypothetical protein